MQGSIYTIALYFQLCYIFGIMFDVRKISLKRILDAQKKTMYAIAKETSISYTTIHKLCTKSVASVDLDVLDKLCENLKCTPNDLLAIEK